MWNNNLNLLYLPFRRCRRECALIKASPKLPFYSRMDTLTDELLQGPHLSSGILVWISSPLALVTMSTHQNWTPSPLIQTAPMCFVWTVLTTWLVGSISLVLCHVTVSVSSIEKDVFEGRTSTGSAGQECKKPSFGQTRTQSLLAFWLAGQRVQTWTHLFFYITNKKGIKNTGLAVCVESLIFPAL